MIDHSPGNVVAIHWDRVGWGPCRRLNDVERPAQGGAVVQAPSCDLNPCAPVPPPTVTVCCVPDGSETECEILTPDHCSAANGTPNAAQSCESNPCGGDSGGDGGDGGDGSSGSDSGDQGSSDG